MQPLTKELSLSSLLLLSLCVFYFYDFDETAFSHELTIAELLCLSVSSEKLSAIMTKEPIFDRRKSCRVWRYIPSMFDKAGVVVTYKGTYPAPVDLQKHYQNMLGVIPLVIL